MGRFMIFPDNLDATAQYLLDTSPQYRTLSLAEARIHLLSDIQDTYKRTVAASGYESVFKTECMWHVWKGVVCGFLPCSGGTGSELMFTADSGGHDVINVVLYSFLDKRDAKLNAKIS